MKFIILGGVLRLAFAKELMILMSGIKKMLSFNHLGNLGRLGNQMFQYASLKGIAKNRGYDFSISPKVFFGEIDEVVKNSDMNIYDVFNLELKTTGLIPNPKLPERIHNFDNELFINCPDNVDLFGYYQTEKYFKHIEDEIRSDFTFNEELRVNCSEFIKTFESKVISLHIRRGDYISNPNHPVQYIEYYKKALELLPPDLPVLVFSDDFNWCDEQDFFDDDRFMISRESSTDADLCMMSFCNYHIIANSSFSWWGAWLAKSESVIAPKNWFGGDCSNKSVEDFVFGNFKFL
jgi:hypothetical protein